jgi:uncharacterized DUF497 family protein
MLAPFRAAPRGAARCRLQFTWSVGKAAVNRAKHGVSFDEARTCFEDPLQVAFYDPHHSDDENREILIGHSMLGRLLLVSYTVRGLDVRIISARKPTRSEAVTYAQGI